MQLTDKRSPEFQHQCLVRQVLAWRADDQRERTHRAKDFLDAWEQKHKTPNSQLRQDVVQQWGWGGRGKHGDWRTGPAGR